MLLVPLLCVLFCFTGSAYAEIEVHFNNSVNCTAGCNITDPTIYIGDLLENSTVILNVTRPDQFFIAPENTTFNVLDLHVLNALLVIATNASINVSNELVFTQVYLHLLENGTLAAPEAEFDGTTVVSYGNTEVTDLSSSHTAFFGFSGSEFYFEDFELENGTIEVHHGANFTTHDSEFSYTEIYFGMTPYLGDVEFESVSANFPFGFYAENQFVISSSNFSAYFPDELANVSFILAGKNNLNVANLHFNSDKIKINNTGSPFINFGVSNNASFDGNLTVPGNININSGANVTFNGTITLSGDLNAQVNSSTQIKATGNLTCGNITLIGQDDSQPVNSSRIFAADNTYSFTVNNAVLSTPSLKLVNFVLKSYYGTTSINGDLDNAGAVHVFEGSSVVVQGNYTQHHNASFGVFDLENTPNRTINLVVAGNASIHGGKLLYNTTETKNNFIATVLQAGLGVTGNFTEHDFDGDADEYTLQVYYTDKAVQISIEPHDGMPKWFGLHWWIWLIIAFGAAVVIISFIAIIVVIRKRSKYEPVRGKY